MRLVFMGTPEFAVPCLEALAQDHDILGVFTQPDRPAGRKKLLKMSPVKEKALELDIPVYQPERLKAPDVIEELRALNPECIVVVAYGQILTKEILEIPPYGCINVHASLLPAYRGAAPIHWAVINGEKVTGITTMLMDEGLDTGDMLLKEEIPIDSESTTGEVHDSLAQIGAKLIIDTLARLQEGTLKPTPQTGAANYASMLKREHEQINWNQTAIQVHNKIRGLNPWPGAFSMFRGELVKLWKSSLSFGHHDLMKEMNGVTPGAIIGITTKGILVQAGEGFVELIEVQPAGKRPMTARDFFHGRHAELGELFY